MSCKLHCCKVKLSIKFIIMKQLLLTIWIWLGTKVIGFELVDVYSPEESENVVAVTFSHSELYIDKIEDIEL